MQKGFSVFELLIAICISSILATTAIPDLSHFYQQQHIDVKAHLIQNQLSKTREYAVITGTHAVLCGTVDGKNCRNTDFTDILIFQDSNKNNILDTAETLFAYESVGYSGRLYLRASNSDHIGFDAQGYAHPYGGVFLCPKDLQKFEPRKVSVNHGGRPYVRRKIKSHTKEHRKMCKEFLNDAKEKK